jgi:hypothetical protein
LPAISVWVCIVVLWLTMSPVLLTVTAERQKRAFMAGSLKGVG